MPQGSKRFLQRRGTWIAYIFAFIVLPMYGLAPPKIEVGFSDAVSRIKAPSAPPVGLAAIPGFGMEAYRPEAERLAKEYEGEAVGFLQSRADDLDRDVRSLSLMTLAFMADRPEAADALTKIMQDHNYSDSMCYSALTYAPKSVAIRLADEGWERRNANNNALGTACYLYRFFGDADRASAMEAYLASLPARDISRRDLIRRQLSALRQRLAEPISERSFWTEQDLIVDRALRRVPRKTRSVDRDFELHARKVCAATRFTPHYLKDRLGDPDCTGRELTLVYNAVGHQHDEISVAPELIAIVDSKRGDCLRAAGLLAPIGTREALAPIERLIVPAKPAPISGATLREQDEDIRRKAHLRLACLLLSENGDRRSLDLMTGLASDPAYSAEDRAALAKASDDLRVRLKVKP